MMPMRISLVFANTDCLHVAIEMSTHGGYVCCTGGLRCFFDGLFCRLDLGDMRGLDPWSHRAGIVVDIAALGLCTEFDMTRISIINKDLVPYPQELV